MKMRNDYLQGDPGRYANNIGAAMQVLVERLPSGQSKATVYDEAGAVFDVFIEHSPLAALAAAGREYGTEAGFHIDDHVYTGLDSGLPRAIDDTIKDIMLEIAEEMETGRLRPFIEGERVGPVPIPHRADLRGENGRGGDLREGW